MTTTPLTDASAIECGWDTTDCVVHVSLPRTLERLLRVIVAAGRPSELVVHTYDRPCQCPLCTAWDDAAEFLKGIK